jgi:membrane protease subunit (stomatin/prohibitin family)
MKKGNIILRAIGILLIAAGLVIDVICMIAFASGDFDSFKLTMIGVPMLGVGAMLTMLSFRTAVIQKGMQRRAEMMAQLYTPCSYCGKLNPTGSKFCNNCGKELDNKTLDIEEK